MIAFLIKSTISMVLLLAVYHLFLEREKMHRFNRFYLLFSIAFSLALPFINIEVYTEVPTVAAIANAPVQRIEVQQIVTTSPIITTPATESINYRPYLLWGLYAAVAVLLLFRFSLNLIRFTKEVKAHRKVKYQSALLVLVRQKTVPYTFLQYIFVNLDDYQNNAVEDELYAHELAHVNQKHTLDILFTEALKIVFWFNPLLYFYKKAIQLNHEFLADEKVVSNLYDTLPYQQLLVTKATMGHPFYLASSLNFSVTKKRLQMMTKTTPALRATIKKAALGIVFCGLVFFLCVQTLAQQTTVEVEVLSQQVTDGTTQLTARDVKRDKYYSGVKVIINDNVTRVNINKIYEELTLDQKRRYLLSVPEPFAVKQLSQSEYNKLQNKKGYRVAIDNVSIDNATLTQHKPKDFASYAIITRSKKSLSKERPQIFEYYLYTQDYFDKNLKNQEYKHYPDSIFKMQIFREFKNGKEVKHDTRVFNNVNAAFNYLDEKDIYQYTDLDRLPVYADGMRAFDKLILDNFKRPAEANKAITIYYLTLIIEKDGTVSYTNVINAEDNNTPLEFVRVVKLGKKWKPGQLNGKSVRSSYTIPVLIQ